MDMRERIASRLKEAMKNQDKARLGTLRLINAAIKDKDIALRGAAEGESAGVGDAEVLGILGKMVKQRQESTRAYEEGGRLDLAEAEQAEIAVIEEFLPKKLSAEEVTRAVDNAIRQADASTIRDMGRVMGALKAEYTGRMDFGLVGPMVKDRLG
ncbi:MAG: GatB/YqeY domain-containing protein [Rhodobacteraceae bacterium]|nr:GatB/YqeY domain-containing protein [Paracoccaceae bacterium]